MGEPHRLPPSESLPGKANRATANETAPPCTAPRSHARPPCFAIGGRAVPVPGVDPVRAREAVEGLVRETRRGPRNLRAPCPGPRAVPLLAVAGELRTHRFDQALGRPGERPFEAHEPAIAPLPEVFPERHDRHPARVGDTERGVYRDPETGLDVVLDEVPTSGFDDRNGLDAELPERRIAAMQTVGAELRNDRRTGGDLFGGHRASPGEPMVRGDDEHELVGQDGAVLGRRRDRTLDPEDELDVLGEQQVETFRKNAVAQMDPDTRMVLPEPLRARGRTWSAPASPDASRTCPESRLSSARASSPATPSTPSTSGSAIS